MNFDYRLVLDTVILDNTVQAYLIALAVFFLVLTILRIFKTVVLVRLRRIAMRTRTDVDLLFVDALATIGWPFYVVMSLLGALLFLEVPEWLDNAMYFVFIIVTAYYAVKVVQRMIDYGARRIAKQQKEDDAFDDSILDVLARLLKAVLWIVALLTILANLGYNITGLLAGAGVFGIAIAFALQNVLADLFASFSIYFDKPFKKGDFIIIGSDMGVVKTIGIKSTRIQTLQGQELIVSNRDLTDSRVNNYGLMERRRAVFEIGVVYQTSADKLAKIPKIIADIFTKIDNADLDRAHFFRFGDFSLDYEIVYYVNSRDYNQYMDIQQSINLALVKAFKKEKIEFAYPTQMIFHAKA